MAPSVRSPPLPADERRDLLPVACREAGEVGVLHEICAVTVVGGVGHREPDVVELRRPAEQEPIRRRQPERGGDLVEEALR